MVKYGVCKHYLFMLDATMHSVMDLKKSEDAKESKEDFARGL